MKKIINIITFLGLLFAGQQVFSNAAAMEVMEIVRKVNHAIFYQGGDNKAHLEMRILDDQGRERFRKITLLRKNLDEKDGAQKYYVFFSKPADIKKMVFMAWKNIDRDDDRWLYLPALDLVKRIAASDERTSFVGSHFFYEDVSGRNIDEDVHEIVAETEQYYVIKSVPKLPQDVEFSYYKNWIDKKTFLPVKAEYYNEKSFVYRTYNALEIKMIEGYPTVMNAQMEDNTTGGKTILTYSSVKYDEGIPENIFSERYLRRAPKRYLK